MSNASPAIQPKTGRPQFAFTGFRPDIQGLRAIAVGVVLLYHANFPFMPGGFVGVDVFFVISGFLITGLLLRESLTTGRISLSDFYARRARRILPAATIVLVATLVLTVLFLPQIRWVDIGKEAMGAAFYVVNWMFAAGTDYLNADVAPSPIQHFWTLSVEEQFYIVWPLVLILLLFLVRGRTVRAEREARDTRVPDQRRIMRLAGVGVLAILVPSLAWSVYYTATHPAPAYFVTTTRLWELAIGAALAVFASYVAKMPNWLGYVLGWTGLVGILVTSLFYTSTVPAFPGAAALLPTLSAAAIIAGGMSGRAERGVGRLLGLKPMRWVGDISYSLYLWHWPLIVVATYLLGGELRFHYGLVVIAISIVLAALSYYFVENPFRDWERLKRSIPTSLWSGLALMLTTAVVAAAVLVVPKIAAPQPEVEVGQSIGAEVLESDEGPNLTGAGAPVDVVKGGFIPAAVDARDDNSIIYENGCHLEAEETQPNGCVFGDESSDTTVVLVGDSHAASWAPAMTALAEKNGWKLVTHTKSACSFSSATLGDKVKLYEECNTWNELVLAELTEVRPDLVVTINAGRRSVWGDGHALDGDERFNVFADGLNTTWRTLNDAGVPVIVINDTPDMGIDVPECVSANPESLSKCAVLKSEAIESQPHPEAQAMAGLDEVELIDMNDWICPDEKWCSAVVGNVLVWRDNQHLTATYAETLALPLGDALERAALSARALGAPRAG